VRLKILAVGRDFSLKPALFERDILATKIKFVARMWDNIQQIMP
jgi:hypothetical protein